MPEHIHDCLNCRPDMVPDFDRADPRFHGDGKCLRADGIESMVHHVFLDGSEIAYTRGAFADREGWALFAGATVAEVHTCPTCTTRDADGFLVSAPVCVEPRFGAVTVVHLEAQF